MAEGGNKMKAKTKKAKKGEGKEKVDKMVLVKRLIDKGKKSGSLTYKEIMDELDEIELNPEQIEKIYEVLESMGIEVISEIEQEEEEEEELDLSVPEGIAIDDPVRMYLLLSSSFNLSLISLALFTKSSDSLNILFCSHLFNSLSTVVCSCSNLYFLIRLI